MAIAEIERVALVVPAGFEVEAERIIARHYADQDLERLVFVRGGDSRAESVRHGLRALNSSGSLNDPECWVAVHDAARPMVSVEMVRVMLNVVTEISRVTQTDVAGGIGIVPFVPVSDTLRTLKPLDVYSVSGGYTGGETIERAQLGAVQTPQLLRGNALLNQLEQMSADDLAFCTDCAAAIQNAGGDVLMIPGESSNVKVTDPVDLQFVEMLLRQRMSGARP